MIQNFLFRNTSLKQTILKNTFWLASGTIVSRVIRSTVIIFAARMLGTEHYGVFTYALSLAALFTIFSDVGLSQILTRELAKKTDDTGPTYAATTLSIKLCLLIIVTILISIVGPHITQFEEAKTLMVSVAFLVAFDSLRSFLYALIRARNEMQKETMLEIITEVGLTVICLSVLFYAPSAHNLALSYMVGSGIGLFATLYVTRNYLANPIRNSKKNLILPILSSAWPFAVIGVFGVFMTNIDSIIIGMFKPASDLGVYAAAQKLISLLYLLPGFLYTSILPVISVMHGNGEKKRLTILIQKTILIATGMSFPIVAGGLLLAGPLMNAIYGYAYIGSTLTFKFLILTLLPIFPGMILSAVLFAENKRRVFVFATAAGALMNIALDFLLIPKYGIEGSAAATLVAQLTLNGIFLYYVYKNHPFLFLSKTRNMVIALLPMSLSVYLMAHFLWPLIVIIPLGALIYFGVLILLKETLIRDVMQGFRE